MLRMHYCSEHLSIWNFYSLFTGVPSNDRKIPIDATSKERIHQQDAELQASTKMFARFQCWVYIDGAMMACDVTGVWVENTR